MFSQELCNRKANFILNFYLRYLKLTISLFRIEKELNWRISKNNLIFPYPHIAIPILFFPFDFIAPWGIIDFFCFYARFSSLNTPHVNEIFPSFLLLAICSKDADNAWCLSFFCSLFPTHTLHHRRCRPFFEITSTTTTITFKEKAN